MEHTYFGVCPGCGKKFSLYENGNLKERKYCSKECWMAYARNQMEEKQQAEQKRRGRRPSGPKTLVPQERCQKCKYSAKYRNLYHCGYMLMKGTTRTALHPEGLTADCLEFEPKRRRKQIETS